MLHTYYIIYARYFSVLGTFQHTQKKEMKEGNDKTTTNEQKHKQDDNNTR